MTTHIRRAHAAATRSGLGRFAMSTSARTTSAPSLLLCPLRVPSPSPSPSGSGSGSGSTWRPSPRTWPSSLHRLDPTLQSASASGIPAFSRHFTSTSTCTFTSTSPDSTTNPASTSNVRVRRPSPYRLPTLPAFLAAFAPLHGSGWRLQVLPPSKELGLTSHSAAEDMISGADLQGRRLVRAYSFPPNREGWRALTALMSRIGEAVEETDHHPVLVAAPASDLPPDVAQLVADQDQDLSLGGYVLYIATHTHTPMPPLQEGVVFNGKPRPGVTGKDLQLAVKVEAAFEVGRGRAEEA